MSIHNFILRYLFLLVSSAQLPELFQQRQPSFANQISLHPAWQYVAALHSYPPHPELWLELQPSAGQAGATAPASIAGAVAQALAEVIAGLVYVNAMKPGHPCICGTWPFVSDLRTGSMSGGSGEQGLLTAACSQMLQYYDLPGGAAAGMADSKMPDAQSGYEKGSTLVMAGLSGLNMVYEAAGMHASLLGFCLESLIIDNDMLGQCMRCVRGVEVNDKTLDIQVMRDVCIDGPGHYLGHDQTISLMQTEYIYPVIGDRSSPKEWEEIGKPNLVETAIKRKNEILNSFHPNHVSSEIDKELHRKFRLFL